MAHSRLSSRSRFTAVTALRQLCSKHSGTSERMDTASIPGGTCISQSTIRSLHSIDHPARQSSLTRLRLASLNQPTHIPSIQLNSSSLYPRLYSPTRHPPYASRSAKQTCPILSPAHPQFADAHGSTNSDGPRSPSVHHHTNLYIITPLFLACIVTYAHHAIAIHAETPSTLKKRTFVIIPRSSSIINQFPPPLAILPHFSIFERKVVRDRDRRVLCCALSSPSQLPSSVGVFWFVSHLIPFLLSLSLLFPSASSNPTVFPYTFSCFPLYVRTYLAHKFLPQNSTTFRPHFLLY
jgi:hypothetical protein